MKKILFIALGFLVLFACTNPQHDVGKPSNQTEEFTVNFSVKDNFGGSISAKVKDGKDIISGEKVAKDAVVIFTAKPTNTSYSIESWTLDGNPVNETKKEYTLKITKNVNVVVKFKEEISIPKDIQIKEVILGNSLKDGKKVKGEDLTENKTIPDFEVQDAKFPILVYHKTEFTNEKVFVTHKEKKQQLTNPVTKAFVDKEYTLVEDEKTSFTIDIEGEGYKPLKLTFNVTYKKPTKKYVDNITSITIVKNKADLSITYGGIAHPISDLTQGKTTIDVFRADPIMTIKVNEEGGEQPNATIKLDETLMAGKNFEAGQHKLDVQFDPLSAGKHHVEITIEKSGYESGRYDFYIEYKNKLTFKSLTVAGKTYTDFSQAIQITLEANATDPIDISGEANEAGATVYFKKKQGNRWVSFNPPLTIREGANLSLRMFAKLDGYPEAKFEFKIKRKNAEESASYIVGGNINVWDANENGGNGEFNNPIQITKDGKNWKVTLDKDGPYEFILKIDRNGKDTADLSKFKISMKDAKTNKIYFDKNPATSKINEFVIFQYSKDKENNDINFQNGEHDLEVSIYYENDVVETSHLIITRK